MELRYTGCRPKKRLSTGGQTIPVVAKASFVLSQLKAGRPSECLRWGLKNRKSVQRCPRRDTFHHALAPVSNVTLAMTL